MRAHRHCHAWVFGSLVRTAWPAGGSYQEQEEIVLDMFEIITDQRLKIAARDTGT